VLSRFNANHRNGTGLDLVVSLRDAQSSAVLVRRDPSQTNKRAAHYIDAPKPALESDLFERPIAIAGPLCVPRIHLRQSNPMKRHKGLAATATLMALCNAMPWATIKPARPPYSLRIFLAYTVVIFKGFGSGCQATLLPVKGWVV
jgi:hypothetical protein